MRFSFEVGNDEKHRVEFYFNQMIGNLKIVVDQKPLIRDFRMFSDYLVKTYEFEIGKREVHKVRIDKIRKQLFAGLRKQKYQVYIDDQLIKELEGI